MYMLHVKIVYRLFYFKTSLFVFFFKPGEFVSTWVPLLQPRSVWGKQKTQATSHRSLLANTESILNIH